MKASRYILVILFFTTKWLFAQNIPSSALESLFKLPNDTSKVNQLNNFARDNRESNNSLALRASERALVIADSLNYKLGMADAYSDIGWIYYRRADFLKALDFTTKSLKISRELNDMKALSSGLNNLGSIYVEQKDYERALQTFGQARVFAQNGNFNYGVERSLNNLAYTNLQMNRLDSAKYFIAQVFALPKVSTSGFANRMLGDINMKEKNYGAAEKVYTTARQLAGMEENTSLLASVLHRLGKLYAEINQIEMALSVLQENEILCRKFSMRSELASTYKIKAHIYEHSGKLKQSVEYLNRYVSLNDSLFNEFTSRKLAQKEEQYQEEINKARFDLLQKESELKEDRIRNGNLKLFAATAGMILFILFGFMVWRNNRQLRTANQLLAHHNLLMEEKEKELKILNTTKDKIFSIISHDLRGPLNNMKSILHLLNAGAMTQEEYKIHTTAISTRFDSLHDDMDNLLQWARSQMKGMKVNAQIVNVAATVNFVKQAFAHSASDKKIILKSLVGENLQVLADEDHLKVILRNLMVNAIKFSNPGGEISVHAEAVKSQIQISVSDTGVGMSKEKVEKLFNPATYFTSKGTHEETGFGLGLLLVKEFVTKNGGNISVSSEAGKGTRFTLTFPTA